MKNKSHVSHVSLLKPNIYCNLRSAPVQRNYLNKRKICICKKLIGWWPRPKTIICNRFCLFANRLTFFECQVRILPLWFRWRLGEGCCCRCGYCCWRGCRRAHGTLWIAIYLAAEVLPFHLGIGLQPLESLGLAPLCRCCQHSAELRFNQDFINLLQWPCRAYILPNIVIMINRLSIKFVSTHVTLQGSSPLYVKSCGSFDWLLWSW